MKINLMIFGFLIWILGIFSDAGGYGADWRFLKSNVQGDFFYDAENLTRSSSEIVGVWLKVVYSEKFMEQEDLAHLSQTVGLWEINCKDRKMCLLSTSHTSKEGEGSTPQVWLPPEWRSIPQNTAMDTLYKELCK